MLLSESRTPVRHPESRPYIESAPDSIWPGTVVRPEFLAGFAKAHQSRPTLFGHRNRVLLRRSFRNIQQSFSQTPNFYAHRSYLVKGKRWNRPIAWCSVIDLLHRIHRAACLAHQEGTQVSVYLWRIKRSRSPADSYPSCGVDLRLRV